MSRNLVLSNDWRRAQLTLPLHTFLICLRPTSLLLVILFMFIICFRPFLRFILLPMTQSSLGVNLILMPTPVRLAVTSYLFLTLAESVMSPPTIQNMAFAKRMSQLSLEQPLIPVKQVVKHLFLSLMRACGLVPGFHIHSSIRINSNTTTSPYKTIPSSETNLFPLNTQKLLFPLTLLALSFTFPAAHLPNMNLTPVLIYI